MADNKPVGSNTLDRCQSCNFDLSRSRSATCDQCDITFNADLTDESGNQDVFCPNCGNYYTVFIIQDEPMTLCKRCLDEAQMPRCNTCGASSAGNLLPVNFSKCCWTARCFHCQLNFDVRNDFAACPNCGESADELNAPTALAESSVLICRQCATLVHETATGGLEMQTNGATATPTVASTWMSNYLNEMWRFVGCVCGNSNPDCFNLIKAAHTTKSLYCRDCEQPYTAFLWDNELSPEQCPRCNGPNVETDIIHKGDTMIECLNCEGKVSMHRHDNQLTDIRQEVSGELETNGGQTRDRAHQQAANTVCLHCGETGAELAVSWYDEDICMMQLCDKCGCAEPLAKWDPRVDDHHQQQPSLPQAHDTPAGFEELNHTCGRLDHLHPIEDDSGDNVLVCDRCSDIICLTECKSPRIPKSVSALRRELKDTFSSGEMGLPYRTVKIGRLTELKPGDQLEFKRTLYSHHGIVVEIFADKEELAVIEYTGQSDAPTVVACLSSAPNKGYIARTLYKFQDIVMSLHRVDYHSLDCFQPSAVIRRATERKENGEANYSVGRSNCEHLSIWAKSNLDLSRQVDAFKERWRKVLEHPFMDVARKGGKSALGIITKRPLGIIVDAIDDVRMELLRLFRIKKGASSQILRTVLRLGLKWVIRGLPFVIAELFKLPFSSLLVQLDAMVVKPFAEFAADKLLPIMDKDQKSYSLD